MKAWTPYSWRAWPVAQSVVYDDPDLVLSMLHLLENSAPLVAVAGITQLRELIARAGRGDAFLVQGGDCCELFSECDSLRNINKISILQAMSAILQTQMHTEIVKIGRMAGQYAKPRSVATEMIAGEILPVYRGDMINAHDATLRCPDPRRMVQAYQHAQQTLAHVQAHDASVFVSHEALHLPYEAALTREFHGRFYNVSTHLPWLGMRTLQMDSAHVEYLRGIENPIGIKVGPDNALADVLNVMQVLNPHNEMGKLILIHRFGRSQVEVRLPALLQALKAEGLNATVICDSMHGNTQMSREGVKLRYFDDLVEELRLAFQIHQHSSIPLAGLHFEMTGDDVLECLGGVDEVVQALPMTSLIDPRLNRQQALRLAERFNDIYRGE